ncbi:unnamed protein product, partial [Pylaiella littoralis]
MRAAQTTAAVLLAISPAGVVGFLAPSSPRVSGSRQQLSSTLRMCATEDNASPYFSSSSPLDRSSLVSRLAAGLLGTTAVVATTAGTGLGDAALAAEMGTKQVPIAVVGAGGAVARVGERGRGRVVRYI